MTVLDRDPADIASPLGAQPAAELPASKPREAGPDAAETGRAGASRMWAWALMLAGSLGIVSGSITIVDKIGLLKNPSAGSFCDIDAKLGCTPVLLSWQSSVLGPPNALLGVIMFAVLATSGLVVVGRGALSAGYRTAMVGLAVFFALFLTWYMQQVAFDIGSLCPFCTICAACVLVAVLATVRMAADDQGSRPQRAFAAMARGNTDIVIVAAWAVLIAAMLYAGIWLL